MVTDCIGFGVGLGGASSSGRTRTGAIGVVKATAGATGVINPVTLTVGVGGKGVTGQGRG
jgi:hypothetical protein